jgi:acyl-coenzyme A synthetase/AMP-(fatty) acid ligase
VVTATSSLDGHKRIELLPLLENALNGSTQRPVVLGVNREQEEQTRHVDFEKATKAMEQEPIVECEVMKSAESLYFLHTSGELFWLVRSAFHLRA